MTTQVRYGWKPIGHNPPVAAETAGKTIERIRTREGPFFAPSALVDEARPTDSALHPAFQWNDSIAAEAYRVEQARYIIRHIVIEQYDDTIGERSLTVRAFVSIKTENHGHRFTSIAHAMSDEDMREQLWMSALADLEAFNRRYNSIIDTSMMMRAFYKARLKHEPSRSLEDA